MDPIVLMQHKWSHTPYVPIYLYFGGLTAGVFIVAAVADLVGTRYARLVRAAKTGAFLALPTLAIAGFFLTIHLGKPFRGLGFPIFFTNYDSWMTWGGWIVAITSLFILAYAALWWFAATPGLRRVVGGVGIPFAVGLAMYTGALLAGAGFVPLWSMEHLPILFLNSGLTTGIAAVGVAVALLWPLEWRPDEAQRPVLKALSLALIVMIAVEAIEIYVYMSYLASNPGKMAAGPAGVFVAPTGGRMAYEYVTQGALAPWFWWGFVALGLVIPLALTVPEFALRRWATPIATAKFVMVLVGGFVLRYVIVHGGDLKAPLVFPPQNWPVPGLGG